MLLEQGGIPFWLLFVLLQLKVVKVVFFPIQMHVVVVFLFYFFSLFPFKICKIGGNLKNQQSASCWYSSPVLRAMEKMSHLRSFPSVNDRTSSLLSTVEKK